ncbi:phosphatidate cytidylyltransferase [Oceanibium sediminis]|uniref:phosphatidate cytidylyltransferase n=1 Tax=Oceanibium sediminis TaxID=2026339 RepID=UPI000DD4BAEA|nr:phosphatidate cytidylyltransferase [Oceanibium sediminis]
MSSAGAAGPKFSDLGVRVISAIALIFIAVVDFWQGGVWVTLLVTLATGLMIWEYRRLVQHTQSLGEVALWIMVAAGGACILATGFLNLLAGVAVLAIGLVGVAMVDKGRRVWMITGLVYIALAMAFLVELRRDPVQGFPLVLWLVSVVIATDVGGYFFGRVIGGPKLWPRVSPKKTWAGTLGGLALALIVGAFFDQSARVDLPGIVILSGIVAIASQWGDLLESWLKRRFGRKDSSSLIPGHGGFLDRFDGLMGGLWAYSVIHLTGVLAG